MDWQNIKKKAQDIGLGTLASLGSVSHDLTTLISKTDWFKSFNDFSSEISKSMDSEFLK